MIFNNKYYLVKYKSKTIDSYYVYGMRMLWDTDKKRIESLSEKHFPFEHSLFGNDTKIIYNDLQSLLDCYEWIEINEELYHQLFKTINYTFGDFFDPIVDDQYNYEGEDEDRFPYSLFEK